MKIILSRFLAGFSLIYIGAALGMVFIHFFLFLLYLFTNDLSNFAIDWGVFGVIMIPSGAFGLMNIYFNFISLKQSGK